MGLQWIEGLLSPRPVFQSHSNKDIWIGPCSPYSFARVHSCTQTQLLESSCTGESWAERYIHLVLYAKCVNVQFYLNMFCFLFVHHKQLAWFIKCFFFFTLFHFVQSVCNLSIGILTSRWADAFCFNKSLLLGGFMPKRPGTHCLSSMLSLLALPLFIDWSAKLRVGGHLSLQIDPWHSSVARWEIEWKH